MENIILITIILIAVILSLVIGAFIGAHLIYKRFVNLASKVFLNNDILAVDFQNKTIELKVISIEPKEEEE